MFNRTILVQTKDDFKNQILNSLTYVDTTPAVNQFTYEDTQKCVKINANRGSFRIALGSVNIGDVICLECELYSISGVLPHYSLDFSNTGIGNYELDTSDLEYVDGAGQWEKVKFKYVVKANAKFSSAVIGLATGEVGVYKLRNVKVSLSSTANLDTISTSYVIKHDNGVMEQFMKVTFSDINVNSAWGGIYGTIDYEMPDFPESFLNDNIVVTVSCFGNMGSAYPSSMLLANRYAPNKTNMGAVTFSRGSTGTSLSTQVHVHAIGRWR